MKIETPIWPRLLHPEWHDILSKPLYGVGDKVELDDPEKSLTGRLGSGPFTIISVRDAHIDGERDETTIMSVGHRQWVQLSTTISLNGVPREVVYDSYQKQWVLPANLSDFGKIHPDIISGAWLKPFH